MTKKSMSDGGQTIVEFAFLILLLFIFILGIMEWGMVLYDKAILTDACREGARAGVMFRADADTFDYDPLTDAEIRAVISNHLQNRLVTFGAPFNAATDVTISPPEDRARGDELNVRVNFNYTFLALSRLVSAAGGNLDGTMHLSARSIMRME